MDAEIDFAAKEVSKFFYLSMKKEISWEELEEIEKNAWRNLTLKFSAILCKYAIKK